VVTILMLLVTFALLVAPATPVGRFLHRHLVVAAAARLNRVAPGHIPLALALCGVVAFVVWLMQGDGLALLGMAAPEASSWLITFEASSYLDVLAAVVSVAATVRVRSIASRWRASVRRPACRAAGTRRGRRPRRLARPVASNDDENQRRAAA
jgi:hypothetical protein